jgi:phage shock protein PspC (stress-responsive transcriptional regulator)
MHPKKLVVGLLVVLVLQRLILVLGQPDLLHDLDAGELKHMDLALRGLGDGATLQERLLRFLGGPENIHHGGFPMISTLFAGLSKVFGTTLTTLRLLPVSATVLAAAGVAVWLFRRGCSTAAVLALVLMVGAPPLFLKWTCVSRGGHLEGIVFAPLMLLLLQWGLSSDRKLPWLLAGLTGGFAVYFTYLAAPLVVILSLGALGERWKTGGASPRALILVSAGALGFLPWVVGLVWLEMPYFDANIHNSGRADEAAEITARTLRATLQGAVSALPHNLWPWGLTRGEGAAYLARNSDQLDFVPTTLTWVLRGIIGAGALLGIVGAAARRSPLLMAVALTPALHYLFVMRMAGNLAWPEVPHRYLVLVFPLLCASIGLGIDWLAQDAGKVRKSLAAVLALGLLFVAGQSLAAQSRWWKAPDPGALAAFDAGAYRQAGIGQIRIDESEAVADLLARHSTGEWSNNAMRGLSLVFPANSDYYLLFRDGTRRPYPDNVFGFPEWQGMEDRQREATVRAALDATRVRAGGDEAKVRELLCRWQPVSDMRGAVETVLADEGLSLGCR